MNSDHLKKFDKNTVIFREGDAASEMFIVHAGSVRLIKQIEMKFETLGVLGRGDFFGEISVIEPGKPRGATAIAVEDGTELIGISLEQFEKMLQGNIEIALRMIRQYAQRMQDSNERLEKLMRSQQELDSGIQDILSHVRKKSEPEEDQRALFGWLQHIDTETKLSLRRPEVMVGRRDTNVKLNPDLDLTQLDQHRTVSRRHARISCYDDGVYLCEETGVVNGTLLNGKQVEPGKVVRVNQNDRLQLGKLEFVVLLQLKKVV